MSASIAPYLNKLSKLHKAFLALWLTDESYGVSIAHYQKGGKDPSYFLGANICVYLQWIGGSFAGAFLGFMIPEPQKYGLDLIFPLAFLGLLSTVLKTRLDILVALTALLVTLLLSNQLELMGHMIIAIVVSSLIGYLLKKGKDTNWKST